ARFFRELDPVMPQEQLLQRRRMANQAGDAKLAEPAHHLVEMLGVDVDLDLRVVNFETVNAGEAVEARDRRFQLGGDRGARQVAQLLQGFALLRAAQPNDAEAVAEGLYLGQDVAGEQHGPALGLDLPDAVLEDGLHQGVEAGRGLVEEQELGVGGERRHQADLLAVPPWSTCAPSWSDRARSAGEARPAAAGRGRRGA